MTEQRKVLAIATSTHPDSLFRKGPRRVLTALALLCAAAVAAVAADPWFLRPQEAQREFQQLLGGLGCGAAVNIEECELGFDPRLDRACTADCGPIPGGRWFCRHHACSMLPLLPYAEVTPALPRNAPDAQVR